MLRVARYAKRSDTGRQRKANEDAFFARSPLFAVADGMGGAQAGEVASGLAIGVLDGGLPGGAGSVEQRLADAVRVANEDIHRRSQDEPALEGMGTTFTVAYLGEEELTVAHVGDSRAYRWRDGALEQLTDDHSLVGELVREGRLTPEEAEEHPQRSIITRALGPAPEVEVDTHTWKAEPGDVYLLCSDGLTSMVHEAGIAAVLAAHPDLDDAAWALVDAANDAGGRDNITVVLFLVEEVGDLAAGPPTEALPADATAVGAAALRAEDVRRAVDADQLRADEAEARRRVPRSPAAPEPAAKRRRRLPGWAKGTIALVCVLGLLLTGAYFASQTVYFVGTDDEGFVTLYRGVPYELPGGVKLYHENFVTGVNVDQLPAGRRKALLDERLRSRDDAVDLVRQVEEGNITAP
jgi:PPM family protein phosphatase